MFTKLTIASLLALTAFAADETPKTVPLVPADQPRFNEILQQSKAMAQELENMRYKACLAAKLTLEQCGQITQGGFVQVLEPKPDKVEMPKIDGKPTEAPKPADPKPAAPKK